MTCRLGEKKGKLLTFFTVYHIPPQHPSISGSLLSPFPYLDILFHRPSIYISLPLSPSPTPSTTAPPFYVYLSSPISISATISHRITLLCLSLFLYLPLRYNLPLHHPSISISSLIRRAYLAFLQKSRPKIVSC
jgi:hypothetical protein